MGGSEASPSTTSNAISRQSWSMRSLSSSHLMVAFLGIRSKQFRSCATVMIGNTTLNGVSHFPVDLQCHKESEGFLIKSTRHGWGALEALFAGGKRALRRESGTRW